MLKIALLPTLLLQLQLAHSYPRTHCSFTAVDAPLPTRLGARIGAHEVCPGESAIKKPFCPHVFLLQAKTTSVSGSGV